MEAIAERIVDDSIQSEKTNGKQSIDSFVGGVEETVKERTDELTELYGDAARDVVSQATAEVQSYGAAKKQLLDGSFQTDAIGASKGAAGLNDKSAGNKIVIDHAALDRDVNKPYWDGVGKHELVHQKEQAATYNATSIRYGDTEIAVHPALVEWHAIRKSGQPMSDLTADYQQHARNGDALVAYIGEQAVVDALKSGDIQSLQEKIMIKQLKEELKNGKAEDVQYALAA